MNFNLEKVLSGVEAIFSEPVGVLTGHTWIAGKVVDEDRMIVLYSSKFDPRPFGILLSAMEIATQYDLVGTDERLVLAIAEELAEPSSPLHHASVEWADGLIAEPKSVVWRGLDARDPSLAGKITEISAESQDVNALRHSSSIVYTGSWEPLPE